MGRPNLPSTASICSSEYPAARAQPGPAAVSFGALGTLGAAAVPAALNDRTISSQLKLVACSRQASRSPGVTASGDASGDQLNKVISGALASNVSQSCSAYRSTYRALKVSTHPP